MRLGLGLSLTSRRGGDSADEIGELQAIFGSDLRGFYTVNAGLTLSGALVDSWADALGLMPTVSATLTNRPSWDAATSEVYTDGAAGTKGLFAALGTIDPAVFNVSGAAGVAASIIAVASYPVTFNDRPLVQMMNNFTQTLGIVGGGSSQSPGSRWRGVHKGTGGSQATSSSSVATGISRRLAIASTLSTTGGIEVANAARVTAAVVANAAASTGLAFFNRPFGDQGDQSTARARCFAFVQRLLTVDDIAALKEWAQAHHPYIAA